MVMTVTDLNSYMQAQGGAALRTFDKSINFNIEAYVQQNGWDSAYGARMQYNNARTSGNFGQRFQTVNYADTNFDGYYDSEIVVGRVIYAQDIVDSIGIAMQRAVDIAESRVNNRDITVRFCHASCHSSCHTSRGRR